MSIAQERTTEHAAEKARELRNAAVRMTCDARLADVRKGRPFNEESYITADRIVSIMKAQDGCCYFYCGCDMLYGSGVNRKTNDDAVTLERVDNNIAHTMDNCILACRACNTKRGHGASFDVMREFAYELKTKTYSYCAACKQAKPVSFFYKDNCRISGVNSTCKVCFAAAQRARRETLIE